MLLGKTYRFWLGLGLLALLCYFVIFWQLNTTIMREWDEARNATHAINMIANGNYLVRMYEGHPDMWETKPPLFIWLQVLCVKLFGTSLWVFRLPSALAALATVSIIVRFLWQQTKSLLPGIAAAVVMLTTYNYTLNHCARTADHDALLIFFETALCISFYRYLYAEAYAKNKYLLYCFICFTLAMLTKSIAVFMVLPGLFIWSLYQLKILNILKNPRVYLYTLASFGVVGLYYYLHELQTPGYLQAVWENELFPRYFNSAKGYTYEKIKSPWKYAENLMYSSIIVWVFIPSAMLFCATKNNHRKTALYFTVLAVVFYTVASLGTFNGWYINPIVPMLAIVCGLGVYAGYNYIMAWVKSRNYSVKTTHILLSIITVIVLYEPIRKQLVHERNVANNYYISGSYGKLFNILEKEHPEINAFTIYVRHHNQSLQFYYELYSKLRNYKLDYVYYTSNNIPALNNMVMCAEPTLKAQIDTLYTTKPIAAFGDCILYKLDTHK